MTTRLSDIFKRFQDSGLLTELRGPDREIGGFGSIEHYTADDVIFVNQAKLLDQVKRSPPAAVVTDQQSAEALNNLEVPILVASNVMLAHALIRQAFDDRDPRQSDWPRIHPSAVIHDSTRVPESATIGPNAVIGKKVVLGEGVVVEAGAVIEGGVDIGAKAVVQARVYIGWGCRIGARVRIKPGTVIGAEGFGMAVDDNKRYHRVPHRGIVVIEDDVIIGANCTIDRATYQETRIRRGCRLDALCHIAHNVFLDEDCLLVAQTGIAGSSRLGKRVIASGQTGILDHKTVADDATLVHRCGVTEDITEPGMYAATPPQPFREYTRNITVFRELHTLLKRVRELEKRLATLADTKD